MHSHAGRFHHKTSEGSIHKTKGLILNNGWRYDVMERLFDVALFRGQMWGLRLRATNLAGIQPGEAVLDVGCGTGTLAIEVQRRVGSMGRVVGIDPGARQIDYARSKAVRRNMPVNFQVATIEQLPFPDDTFDVVLSTIMMHHLPNSLKRQGLAEIARVLKPGGRLVIADFTRPQERRGKAAKFHAGGSNLHDLVVLIEEAGFAGVQTEEMPPLRFSAFPGAGCVRAIKEDANNG